MRRWILRSSLFILAMGTFAHGWGYQGHQRINRSAASLLNGEFGNYILNYSDSLALHAPDPDKWKKDDKKEGYRHYIDIDLYSEYPFGDLPDSERKLRRQFGRKNVKSWGAAPYNIEKYSKKIIKMMKKGQWEELIIPLAALGHYMADIHMPLHTVANYNGQLTGNDGIHFRWEVPLVDDFTSPLVVEDSVYSITNPLSASFNIVRESFLVHTQIIRADSIARQALPPEEQAILGTYDRLPEETEYYKILFNESGELAQDQLEKAAAAVASFWLYCWKAAGSPMPIY